MTWSLGLTDCMGPDGLSSLADKSIDVCITDPPYSRDLYDRTRTNKGRADLSHRSRATAIALASNRIGSTDEILPEVAAHLRRVTRRWILVFSDVEIAPRWREHFGDFYVRSGVWVKPDPTPQISADRPGQGFEFLTISHPHGRKRWNGGGRAAVWIQGREQVDRPDHPCQKPLGLMEKLVADFTESGETVLDPFTGSGTTGVAAIRLGRRFIGFERDPTYHTMAVKRLSAAREQLRMPFVDAPITNQGEAHERDAREAGPAEVQPCVASQTASGWWVP